MNNSIGRLLESLFGFGKAWWIEIQTQNPSCIYYFGPFSSESEASQLKAGYIEDLEQEGAQNIRVSIRRCHQPTRLTIEESEEESAMGDFRSPAFSQT